jgi:hypothetical protein
MGARPMARLIQDTIRSALADELLFGKLASGGHVTVDLDKDGKKPLAKTASGKVLVIDGGGSLRCALVGDQLAILAPRTAGKASSSTAASATRATSTASTSAFAP